MASDVLSQHCGRIFEVCFNCGLLTFLSQQEQAKQLTTRGACAIYQSDLKRLRFHPMAMFAINQAQTIGSSPQLRKVAEQILLHFAFKGYLQGLHFLEEYLRALGQPYVSKHIHVRYVQAAFREENSMGMIKTNPAADEQVLRRILAQLDPELRSANFDLQAYSRAGRFLKADCLLLLQWGGTDHHRQQDGQFFTPDALPEHPTHPKQPPARQGGFLLTSTSPLSHTSSKQRPGEDVTRKHWRILCLDFSVHSLTMGQLRDPNYIETLRLQLASEWGYLRTRGIFSNLGYDVAEGLPEMLFARGLEDYLTAFKKKDKESAKLIQAGGYAYDFYTLLCQQGLIQDQDEVFTHAFGMSDRDMTSMHIHREHLSVLKACQKIYQNSPSDETINHARDRVVEIIHSTARQSFKDGQGQELFEHIRTNQIPDGCNWLPSFIETIPVLSTQAPLSLTQLEASLIAELGGQSKAASMTVQQAHSKLVREQLKNNLHYLFLTGNPGIGKTTAIVEWLLDCERRGEGFLFFYLSPRTSVNLDLIDKFRIRPTGPLHGSVLALTTSATILDGRQDPTVLYASTPLRGQGTFTRQGVQAMVTFLEYGSSEHTSTKQRPSHIDHLLADQIWDPGRRVSGVLYSICQAIAANMQQPLSNAVVATASIQSLKKKGRDQDTLIHLEKIFASAFDRKTGNMIPARMHQLAQRMPHLVFMLDEITGDDSGVAFLAGFQQFAEKYELFSPSSPFHTKIIIADASVVNKRVIERHLASSVYEPEKIYFQHISNPSHIAPVTQEAFVFKQQPATAINTNAYPADELALTYHLCIECQRYNERMTQLPKSELDGVLQKRLVRELLALIQRSRMEVPQIIVYIQNKSRLNNLIEQLKKELGRFEREKDYLEIHASISERARKVAAEKRTEVRVVFMTASASRGLSFPDATHFLIDIPRFAIEANTMEILQVMYRGRGGQYDRDRKYVQFYLSDQVLYQEEADRERALRERLLGIVDMLIILKTSLMTRIKGYGQIRRHAFQMIPVGGKAVSSAGGTFPDTMAELVRQLTNQARQKPDQPEIAKIADYLQELFAEGNYHWETQEIKQAPKEPQKKRYLPERKLLLHRFRDLASQGFDQLLQWPAYELIYPSGGFVTIPCQNKKLDQRYLFDLRERARTQRGKQALAILRRLVEEEKEKFPDQLYLLMEKARDLLWRLQQANDDETQQFTQSSTYLDQYAALPLLAFLVPEVVEDYFATEKDDLDPLPFRHILAGLLKTWYPAETILPIGDDYRSYPFLIFRSFNLEEIRHRLFSGSSLFASYEMNVLNMLLSTQTDDESLRS